MVSEVRDVGVVGVNEMVGVVLWDLKRLYFANKFSYQPQRISVRIRFFRDVQDSSTG